MGRGGGSAGLSAHIPGGLRESTPVIELLDKQRRRELQTGERLPAGLQTLMSLPRVPANKKKYW